MSVAGHVGPLGPRAIARFYRTRDLDVRVEGLEHLPRRGGVLLAARHYHHLYDGATLIDALPRVPRIFVALDWAATPRVRAAMELACRLAGWPMALRVAAFDDGDAERAYDRREVLGYVRRAVADGADVLRDGGVLVVFPEGVPTLDVGGVRPKPSDDTFLPFHEGFMTIVALAQRDDRERSHRGLRIPIVPVGLAYEALEAGRKRFRVTVRLGEARYFDSRTADRKPFVAEIAAAVRRLSLPEAERPGEAEAVFTLPRQRVLAGELANARDALSGSRDERVAARHAAGAELRATRARLTTARDRLHARDLRDIALRLERTHAGRPL